MESFNLILEKVQAAKKILDSMPKIKNRRFVATKFLDGETAYEIDVSHFGGSFVLLPYDSMVIMSIPMARKVKQACPEIEIYFPAPEEDQTLWQEIKKHLANCLQAWSASKWK